jgi:hypothetical protein
MSDPLLELDADRWEWRWKQQRDAEEAVRQQQEGWAKERERGNRPHPLLYGPIHPLSQIPVRNEENMAAVFVAVGRAKRQEQARRQARRHAEQSEWGPHVEKMRKDGWSDEAIVQAIAQALEDDGGAASPS